MPIFSCIVVGRSGPTVVDHSSSTNRTIDAPAGPGAVPVRARLSRPRLVKAAIFIVFATACVGQAVEPTSPTVVDSTVGTAESRPGVDIEPEEAPPWIASTSPRVSAASFVIYVFSREATTASGGPALVPVADSTYNAWFIESTLANPIIMLHPLHSHLGYDTYFPSVSGVGLGQADGTALVDIGDESYKDPDRGHSIRGRAQIVFTATQFPEYDSVLFQTGGRTMVTRFDDALFDRPLRRSDFYELLGQDIYVDQPAAEATVGPRFKIAGVANIPAGNLLHYVITTDEGATVISGFTTPGCGTDCWGDFSLDVHHGVTEPTPATLTVTLALNGSATPGDVIRHPIVLTGDEQPEPPRFANEAEHELVGLVKTFAGNQTNETFAKLPLAEEVALGLGPDIVRTVRRDDLADASAWTFDLDGFRRRSGTISMLEEFLRTSAVVAGDFAACLNPVSSKQPRPTEMIGYHRVSARPNEQTRCKDWYSVDLFLDETGQIVAMTLDWVEP